MKKMFLGLIIIVLCVSMLSLLTISGCKDEGVPEETMEAEPAEEIETEEEAKPTEEVEEVDLLVWWWGEGDTPGSRQWLEETAGKFEELNPHINIELVEQTMDQLYPAWEAAIAAQEGPDIQFLWTGIWALEDVWRGNVEDITKWIPQSEIDHWLGTDGISYQGKPWLVPWYQISIVMLYNKVLFEEAGLDPDNPPTTWEEFIDDCAILKDAGTTPLSLGMKDAWGAAWLYSLMAPAQFDSIDEFKIAATEPGTFLTDEHKDWLEKLYELNENGYINENVMSLDFFQGREIFLQGQSGFGLATNGQAIQWIEEMGGSEVADIMKVPIMGPGEMAGKINTQSHSFCIPTFAADKQEAADFLTFMHQEENLNSWYEITKNFPTDDRFDTSLISSDVEKRFYDYLVEDGIGYAEIYIPVLVDGEGAYVAAQMVLSGDTPDEAAQVMEDVAEKWRELDPVGVENFINWSE